MRFPLSKISSLALLFTWAAQLNVFALEPVDLRAEYLVQPQGLDVAKPALSWHLREAKPERRGVTQSAYRVLVASDAKTLASDKGDLWDSGKVKSSAMVSIGYAGQELKSGQPCFWKVMVWDEKDEASAWSQPTEWTMGLLSAKDWKAQWIGAKPRIVPPTPENFGYRSPTVKKKETPKWVQIDLGKEQEFSKITLWPAWPLDIKSPPGDGFPARFKIEVADEADFAKARVVVDRTAEDVVHPGAEPMAVEFPPAKGRYVRLTATHLGGQWRATWDVKKDTWVPEALPRNEWKLALAEMAVQQGDENFARGAAVTDSDKTKDNLPGGWSRSRLTDGVTESSAGSDYEIRPAVLMRKPFTVKSGLRRATLYGTALGCYELSLNGLRVSDEQLAPGWTIYDKRVLYQTYDLTKQLKAGENMLGAHVGDGWFRMPKEMFDQFDSAKRFAGYKSYPGSEELWFLGQLQLEYEDGTTELVKTDESWICQPESPVRTASMFTGVRYDANFEIPGWDLPGAEAKGWQAVVARPLADDQIVSAQKMEPIRVLEEIKPVKKTDLGKGRTIYDFGRVIAGVCRVTSEGRKGEILKLRHAEALKADGKLYVGNLGGSDGNHDQFVFAKNGSATFQPPFTYHGFRYVEVSGPVKVEDITALTLGSDVKQAFVFESSDKRMNTLCEMVENSYRNNLVSLLVDVSGRDERRPWLGDSFTDEVQSLSYLYQFAAFGANEEQVLLDAMGPDGTCPPHLRNANKAGANSSAGWSDACVVIPYTLWLNYGDRRTLEAGYEGAKAFMDMILRNNPTYVPGNKYTGAFGDWLSSRNTLRPGAKAWSEIGNTGAPADFFAASWWAYSAGLVSQMAEALGKTEEAKTYADMSAKVRAALLKTYAKPDGIVANDTQSVYGVALSFGLLEESARAKAVDNMVKAIAAYDNHFATGSFTTIYLLKALAEGGQQPLAYRMVMQPTMPSYGYMVDQGATTVWERYDAWTPELGFNPNKLNGLSHVGMNSVFEWIVSTVAGLKPDFENPGYRHFFVSPQPEPEDLEVSWKYESMSGPIRCKYATKEGLFLLTLEVPPNTRATVTLPKGKKGDVKEGGVALEKVKEIKVGSQGEDSVVCEVGSGTYQFTSARE